MTSSNAPFERNQILEFLQRETSYPDHPQTIETIETHISWIFLTDKYAYKLKKPVHFEFVDFSTPDLRYRACKEEVRLNQRLAEDVYLAVLPVTMDLGGKLQLDGTGDPVDWVVQMRRLPADKCLSEILRTNRLTDADRQEIARLLLGFYSQLPSASITPHAYREALDCRIRDNRDTLLLKLPQIEHARVRRITGAQLWYLTIHADLFDQRVRAGRVVEGHGDLRPEHIYLEHPPKIIDCVEFSQELRQIDVADELAFLEMECERLGDGNLGRHVLSAYQQRSNDSVPESLLRFYCCYRACVRAKVAALRVDQQISGARVAARLGRQYIDWADHNAARLGPPLLLFVGGLMGSGKTTLATNVAASFGAEMLSTDQIRRAMLGTSDSPAPYGKDKYTPELRNSVYNQLFRQAAASLNTGCSVILDGTFLARAHRERARELAIEHGAESLHVWCACPRDTALARIAMRRLDNSGNSEARSELFDAQLAELEPVGEDEPSITIDTTTSLPRRTQAVYESLRRLDQQFPRGTATDVFG